MDYETHQFLLKVAATVSGGVVLTFIYFVFREHIFSLPVVCGVWECKMTVKTTAYSQFHGMQVFYRVVLLQEGGTIVGTGEKDREDAANGGRQYSGAGRIPIEVTGRIEKCLTKPDIIRVHWKENGEIRISSTIHTLKVSGTKVKGNLVGEYYSTAGECCGRAYWTRIA